MSFISVSHWIFLQVIPFCCLCLGLRLTELSSLFVEHFVSRNLEAGCSWDFLIWTRHVCVSSVSLTTYQSHTQQQYPGVSSYELCWCIKIHFILNALVVKKFNIISQAKYFARIWYKTGWFRRRRGSRQMAVSWIRNTFSCHNELRRAQILRRQRELMRAIINALKAIY